MHLKWSNFSCSLEGKIFLCLKLPKWGDSDSLDPLLKIQIHHHSILCITHARLCVTVETCTCTIGKSQSVYETVNDLVLVPWAASTASTPLCNPIVRTCRNMDTALEFFLFPFFPHEQWYDRTVSESAWI